MWRDGYPSGGVEGRSVVSKLAQWVGHGIGLWYRRWAVRRRGRTEAAIYSWALASIRRQRYCVVVTVADGNATARVVEPFHPDGKGTIRFGTDPESRKVHDINRSGTCVLVYADSRRRSCVTVECSASIEPRSSRPWFKAHWSAFWPDGSGEEYTVVKCVPQAMEVWAGLAVIAPDPFGRRSLRLERHDGEWAVVREVPTVP